MRKMLLFTILFVSFLTSNGQTPTNNKQKLEEWKDARFGMFIHWGPVSLKGTEIGWSRGREIPVDEYDNLYKKFDAPNFDANSWVTVAKAAGMKYIILTTKHHDGFCLWNTRQTEFNVMNSPLHRDVVKELAEACKKQGIAFGTYYSTTDWHHPEFPLTSPGGQVARTKYDLDAYTGYLKRQVAELLLNYGPLFVLWFDVPQRFDAIRGQGVIDFAHTIQPDIIINNRTGAKGDFDTPEQRVGGFQNDRPWETCMTIANQWAWKPNDEVKSLEQCLQSLVRSAGGDGNLLFNVGPMPDGRIEPLQVERLKEMGKWLQDYGRTIYGTRGGPLKPTDWGVSTRKGKTIYLHILKWTGNNPKITIPDLGMEIKSCRLAKGGEIKLTREPVGYTIEFSKQDLQPINTIVELECAENVMAIKPIVSNSNSLSYLKPLKASSNPSGHWSNHQWVELNAVTNGDWSGAFWEPEEKDLNPWIELDLGKPQKISQAFIYERGKN
ncbi:MAG: alpha-L-fucosidase, partial [Prolixibacteraceae bacterium]|nr:alpha-L-fucosidase [Prolixibacteraceae bacterium]